MVDLDRQIRVTQARQGGFSAHVLPEAIGYAPEPPAIVYFTANSVEAIGDYNTFNVYENIVYLESGGPFGEPCAGYPTSGSKLLYSINLGDFSPGAGDYTFEFWFQGADILDAGAFTIGISFADCFGENGYSQIGYELTPSNSLFLSHSTGNLSGAVGRQTATSIEDFVWIHVAVVRSQASHVAYVNGTLATNVVFAGDDFEPTNLNSFAITTVSVGRFGQMRYTKAAIYSGTTITPPTAPFFVP